MFLSPTLLVRSSLNGFEISFVGLGGFHPPTKWDGETLFLDELSTLGVATFADERELSAEVAVNNFSGELRYDFSTTGGVDFSTNECRWDFSATSLFVGEVTFDFSFVGDTECRFLFVGKSLFVVLRSFLDVCLRKLEIPDFTSVVGLFDVGADVVVVVGETVDVTVGGDNSFSVEESRFGKTTDLRAENRTNLKIKIMFFNHKFKELLYLLLLIYLFLCLLSN